MTDQIEDLAVKAANTHNVSDLNDVLSLASICDREKVLAEAVNIYNVSHFPFYEPFELKIDMTGGKHTDTLVHLIDDKSLPVLSFDVPASCTKGGKP